MNKSNKPALPVSAAPQPTETPSDLAPASATYPVWRDADRTYHRVEQIAAVYNAAPQAKIDILKEGRPATDVEALAALMSITKETLMQTLRLSRATVNRKARAAQTLSPDETERLLGVETLIAKVATMVAQSGDPGGFDAAGWMARWLETPVPALGARTPGSFMDTMEGQRLVAGLLASTQSGAYA